MEKSQIDRNITTTYNKIRHSLSLRTVAKAHHVKTRTPQSTISIQLSEYTLCSRNKEIKIERSSFTPYNTLLQALNSSFLIRDQFLKNQCRRQTKDLKST
jgi:hypothetical protein